MQQYYAQPVDEAPVLGVRPPPVKTGTAGSHLSCSNLSDADGLPVTVGVLAEAPVATGVTVGSHLGGLTSAF